MVAKFLKIAGVKTTKQFYKKYPTEAAFFKAHPEAKKLVKKAQVGAYIGGNSPLANPEMIDFKEYYDKADYTVTGMTEDMRKEEELRQAQLEAAKKEAEGDSGSGATGGLDMGQMMQVAQMAAARKGHNIRRAQEGITIADSDLNDDDNGYAFEGGPDANGERMDNALNAVGKYAPLAGKAFEIIDMFKAQDEALHAAQQMEAVSKLALQASGTRPEQTERRYTRPEDMVNQGSKFFPVYGVGTRVGKNGALIGGNPTEVQNLFSEGSIYDDLGYSYTALNNSEGNSKTYRGGGPVHKAQYGDFDDYTTEPDRDLRHYNEVNSYLRRTQPTLSQQTLSEYQNKFRTMPSSYMGSDEDSAWNSGETPDTPNWFGRQSESLSDSKFGKFSQKTGLTSIAPRLAGMASQNNAGSNLGGTIGGLAGSAFGPIGSMIGSTAGTLIGGALDKSGKRTSAAQKRTMNNISGVAMNNAAPGIYARYSSVTRNGGNVPSYEEGGNLTNPQLITQFGGLTGKQVYDYAHDGMQSLRSGGHLKDSRYTPVSHRGLQTMALGGELQTTWGGGVRTISQNPYADGTGEMVKFDGNSHDEEDGNGNTGIGVKYGKKNDSYTDYAEYGADADADVEVEEEPGFEMVDPKTGEKTLQILGDRKLTNGIVSHLNDPDVNELVNKYGKNRKFKHIGEDIGKREAKASEAVRSAAEELSDFELNSVYDKPKFYALQAKVLGNQMKLKEFANDRKLSSIIQNSMNEVADESKEYFGAPLEIESLSKGQVKWDTDDLNLQANAKKGISLSEDEEGDPKMTAAQAKAKGYVKVNGKWVKTKKGKAATTKEEIVHHEAVPGVAGRAAVPGKKYKPNENAWWRSLTPAQKAAHNAKIKKMIATSPEYTGTPAVAEVAAKPAYDEVVKTVIPGTADTTEEADVQEEQFTPVDYKRSKLMDIANMILPFLRPTDQEPLDPNQLLGEMYALSNNQVEPSPMQSFQPELGTPYDISYQDILNANQADYRAAQKLAQNNPEYQAILNAQKYAANEKVLGEQFRANQAMRDKVYSENRNLLNQAKLQNIAMFDTQAQRMSEAVSNTKATAQAALNSISDKVAKNKLENKTLGVYENMYNYRYDPSGRAINMNPFFQPNIGNAGSKVPVYDAKGNLKGYQEVGSDKGYTPIADDTTEEDKDTKTTDTKSKYGKSVTKNNRNSSVLKALRNL
jgi:hypothetical protein